MANEPNDSTEPGVTPTQALDLSNDSPPETKMALLLTIFPLLILSVMEHGIALPIIPNIGEHFGATPTEVGYLYSIQYVGQFATAALWGWLSDRYGRKNMFILTLLTGALAEFLTAYSWSLESLMISRLLVGLTAGNIAIGSAIMSDMTTEQNRSKGMALVGISYGLGFVIGPAIGGISANISSQHLTGALQYGLPFLIAGIILIIAALIAVRKVPVPSTYAHITEWNHKVAEKRAKEFAERQKEEANAKHHNRFPLIAAILMCILYFIYTIAISILETSLSPFLKHHFELTPKQVGFTFTGIGLILLFMQGMVSRLGKYIKDYWLILIGGIIASTGYLLSATTITFTGFFIMLGVGAMGRGLFYPGVLSQTSKCYDSPSLTGRVMGFLNSFGSLGRIFGAALSGIIVEHYVTHPYAPYFIPGVIFLTITLLWGASWGIAKKVTNHQE